MDFYKFKKLSFLQFQYFCENLQMGSKCKKALVAESVRESLHSWCKRVKERSKRDSAHSITTRSVCSLESMVDERDEITIASGTLSRSSSFETSNQVTVQSTAQLEAIIESSSLRRHEELPPTMADFLSQSARVSHANGLENNAESGEDSKVESLFDLFKRT